MSALDGRAPLVLDVRELGRRAGAMMTIRRTVPAPTDLVNPMIGIPAGSDLAVDVMAESVIEGVLITGTAQGVSQGFCSRCLEPVSSPLTVDVQELFQYADANDDDQDEELPTFDGELIDLEPTIRDAVVLALPIAPVCDEDCQGLCSECGVRIADNPGHHHDQTDPRWAVLGTVFAEDADMTEDDAVIKEALQTKDAATHGRETKEKG